MRAHAKVLSTRQQSAGHGVAPCGVGPDAVGRKRQYGAAGLKVLSNLTEHALRALRGNEEQPGREAGQSLKKGVLTGHGAQPRQIEHRIQGEEVTQTRVVGNKQAGTGGHRNARDLHPGTEVFEESRGGGGTQISADGFYRMPRRSGEQRRRGVEKTAQRSPADGQADSLEQIVGIQVAEHANQA